MKEFLILTNSEDGEVNLRLISRQQLLLELERGDWGNDPTFFTAEDVRRQGSWDFANEGSRGRLIVEASAVAIPKTEETVTKWGIE